jgi:hypothetical protein
MKNCFRSVAWATLLGAVNWGASSATASVLLATNVTGQGNFLVVNQTNGNADSVAPSISLGPDSWAGLAAIPGGRTDIVYALQNPTPPRFGDPPTSRLAKINTAAGTAELLPLFDVSVLGSPGPTSTAIAISPLDPTVATVVAFEFNSPGDRLMFKVSLDTGAVLGPALVLPQRTAIRAMTYSPDGATLYVTNDVGALATLNPTTGVMTTIGDPAGLSSFINGLAFRPEDGALFAIDAGLNDRLVQINPADGSLVKIVGPFGISGPAGLAFIAPPAPALAGDANDDGRVDLEDLNAVRNNFGAVGVGKPGDANVDGLVDLTDLNLVRNHFGSVQGAAAPEPAGWALGLLGSVAALAWRRSTSKLL